MWLNRLIKSSGNVFRQVWNMHLFFVTSAMAKLCFHVCPLVCLSACLSVCPSVCPFACRSVCLFITEKRMNGFPWNYEDRWDLVYGTFCNILGMFLLTLSIQDFSCDQATLWMVFSVPLSVCHTFLTMFPSSYHPEIFRKYYQWQMWCPFKRSRSEVKGQGHRGHDPI